ncbi:glycosyltransferase family 2 protein [Flavobacteriaceae bacterium 14752]|uniref:glycosyltransferase family 2 protein n=1 Tax=Mesohalobacter salilacus TaxID=2491711 RepID=UPI000F63E23D|nr:glycosyltransferase family 2 protein [Flavobacteriaceae bacterium 14752]
MQQQLLVSIITASYNAEKYIDETIKSVQAQTYQNWEMLITDDCSTDNTCQIIQDLAKSDSRIKLFKLKQNAGPAVARNNSIKEAKGRFIAFLDADDIWFDFHIKDSISFSLEKKAPFVFASYKRSNENLEFVHSDFIVPSKVTYSDILKSNSISCLTAFIDIKKLGKKYMPEIRKRQDMGLWLKYIKDCKFAYGIQKPHAIYRMRENSLSRNKMDLIKHQWRYYRKVEKLNFIESFYYLLCWMYYGYFKYKN